MSLAVLLGRQGSCAQFHINSHYRRGFHPLHALSYLMILLQPHRLTFLESSLHVTPTQKMTRPNTQRCVACV
jgi:hypothetical protein